jgi:hypothetical protein
MTGLARTLQRQILRWQQQQQQRQQQPVLLVMLRQEPTELLWTVAMMTCPPRGNC